MHHDETMHTHEHTHADGSTHTHEHTHPHDHDHPHTHDHGCDEHACSGCSGCSGCADPKQELMALMKYMVGHNTAHANELAQLRGDETPSFAIRTSFCRSIRAIRPHSGRRF